MRSIHIRRLNKLSPLQRRARLNVGPSSSSPQRPMSLPFSTAIENTHEVSDLIHEYASKPQSPISLKDMMLMDSSASGHDYLTSRSPNRQQRVVREEMLMTMADMLQEELPVRLAHRIQDLDSIEKLQDMPSVQQVRSIYLSSFLDLLRQPRASSPQAEQDFGNLLKNLYQIHSNVLRQMARGILELKYQRLDMMDNHHLTVVDEAFLDRFYMSRVGIRVLAGQYLSLRHQLLNDPSGSIPPEYIGMISTKTSPSRVVQRAIEDATMLCQQQHGGVAPKVQVSGRIQLTFCYVPTHLHYILLELLKNSMRATMECHKSNNSDHDTPPPIQVVIADGKENEDVIIKVSDQGGGIPRSEMDQIWSYLFTTASPQVQREFFESTKQLGSTENGAILAGLGYGLPLSRAYARYFGGELDLVSMEGLGTDAFCHLVRLADKGSSLPV